MVTENTMLTEYEQLPEGIKMVYSFREYTCMTDAQRATIVQDECEPEWEEI